MVQWLGLRAFTAVGLGLIPAQGTKILQAMQTEKKKPYGIQQKQFKERSS